MKVLSATIFKQYKSVTDTIVQLFNPLTSGLIGLGMHAGPTGARNRQVPRNGGCEV